MIQPTDDVSALARLREKLAGMTAGPWRLIYNASGEAFLFAAKAPGGVHLLSPKNALGIHTSVSLARFVADEETGAEIHKYVALATAAAALAAESGQDLSVIDELNDAAAAAILALIASAGEEA